MPPRSERDRLMGAAVLKMSFRIRGEEDSESFKAIYRGVLTDLHVDDVAVEKFLQENVDEVRKRALAAQPRGIPH